MIFERNYSQPRKCGGSHKSTHLVNFGAVEEL